MVGEFSYCPVETKQLVKHKISVSSWSPKTDLIALGTQAGNVSVHRYKMTCIWESAPSDLGSVTCIAWRPDGQSLCASYSSGTVRLFLTNDGFIYHEISHGSSVTHLTWTDYGTELRAIPITDSASFFPDLNALTMFKSDTNFTSSDTFKLAQLLANVNENFTILMLLCDGVVHLYGCATFPIASWRLEPRFRTDHSQLTFLGCQFSSCLRYLWILYSWIDSVTGATLVELQKIPCNGLVDCAQQLRTLSVQNSSVRICKSLLNWSFSQICVSWEDMILEVDAKFTKYGRDRLSQNKNWSLSVELLEFILFGNCPYALRKFLVEDWTAASLKRTGIATLKAYESIKTICFQQLQLILQRLLFHASELLGCLRDTPNYAQFGIPAAAAVKLCSTTGSVLQKTQELYLVIEKSVAHLRAFFKWLYVAIPGLSGHVLPNDFTRVTPTERELVIDFITNYLQPVFVQNELQSYHVDLVEQYIRPGEVRKPLESVVGRSLSENQDRAKLRDLVNLTTEQVQSEKFPVGMFNFNPKATLADLIQKNLQEDIDAMFQPPSLENFSRGCLNFDQAQSFLICRSQSPQYPLTSNAVAFHAIARQPSESNSAHPVANDNCTLLAWKLPVVDASQHDSVVLMELGAEKTDLNIQRSFVVQLNELPSVANQHNMPYELMDFKFYSAELLLLLICRAKTSSATHLRSDSADEPMLSWLVMLPVQDVLALVRELPRCSASCPLWSSEAVPPTQMPFVKLSEVITESHIEALPWHAIKLATNGERSIVFVLFKGAFTCRVYLLERSEPDEQNLAVDEADETENNNKTEAAAASVPLPS